MKNYRGYNQADANQAEIVTELRDRGAIVVLIEHPVDLLVGYRGEWSLVEVKSSQKAKIRPSQRAFLDQCQAAKVNCILMTHLDDVEYWFPKTFPGEKNTVNLPENA